MRDDVHEVFNTVLRAAMADLTGEPIGYWGLLGCYWDGEQVTWKRLEGLTDAAKARATITEDDDGNVVVSTTGQVLAALAAELTGVEGVMATEDLCGIAAVAVGDDDGARICVADAAFIDGFRHQVTWLASDTAPEWAILSPIEQARDDPCPERCRTCWPYCGRTPTRGRHRRVMNSSD
ncbi:hypothetical protein GCM10029992_37610 [Glycomyces albus]